MKKRVLLSGMMWCLTSIPSMACYLIDTEGSGEFRTSGYWKEGGEIKFFMPNGVIGVTESEVQNITRIKGSQCGWVASQLEEEGREDVDLSAAAADARPPITVSAAAAPPQSEAYQRFQDGVVSLELQMRRLGTMSKDELLDLAKTAELLKKQMLDSQEGEALHPLLDKVSAGLEQIEAMVSP